jgi:putative DNA primase/helicase
MIRAASALQFISPVERSTWVAMGMALQAGYGDAARDIWLDWSRGADSFRELDARSVWKSFKGAGISLASLFHEAKQNGWRDEGFQKPNASQIAAQKRAAEERASKEGQERIKAAHAAAKKAHWILSQCKNEEHAYLDSKGFPKLKGLVWRPEQDTNLLCIPMHVNGALAGLQMIDRDGAKKFLSGQITAKAEFCISAGAIGSEHWWVEGYASGLSLQASLNALKLPYRLHITFSAQNLQRMAHSGYVIADNDSSDTGMTAARATELPYWMPDTTGTDINDFHKLYGTFKTSQELRRWLSQIRDERDYYTG